MKRIYFYSDTGLVSATMRSRLVSEGLPFTEVKQSEKPIHSISAIPSCMIDVDGCVFGHFAPRDGADFFDKMKIAYAKAPNDFSAESEPIPQIAQDIAAFQAKATDWTLNDLGKLLLIILKKIDPN